MERWVRVRKGDNDDDGDNDNQVFPVDSNISAQYVAHFRIS